MNIISSETLDSFNPITGEVIGTVPTTSDSELEAQLSTIKEALPDWQSKRLKER